MPLLLSLTVSDQLPFSVSDTAEKHSNGSQSKDAWLFRWVAIALGVGADRLLKLGKASIRMLLSNWAGDCEIRVYCVGKEMSVHGRVLNFASRDMFALLGRA
jgi:hypothetical protein